MKNLFLIVVILLLNSCGSKAIYGVYGTENWTYLDLQEDSTYKLYTQKWSQDYFFSKGEYTKTSKDTFLFKCFSRSKELKVNLLGTEKNSGYTGVLVEAKFDQLPKGSQSKKPQDYSNLRYSLDSLTWYSIDFDSILNLKTGREILFKLEYKQGVLDVMSKRKFVSSWLPLEPGRLNKFRVNLDFIQINYLNTDVFIGVKTKKGIRISSSVNFLDNCFYRIPEDKDPFAF